MPEDKKQDTKTPTAEAPAETTATQEINLTVADLRNLRTIIDIASQRGAFKGNELKPVGETYDKLDQFVKAVDAKAQAENPAPADGEAKAEASAEEKK
jgi:uncharacterized protein YggE